MECNLKHNGNYFFYYIFYQLIIEENDDIQLNTFRNLAIQFTNEQLVAGFKNILSNIIKYNKKK